MATIKNFVFATTAESFAGSPGGASITMAFNGSAGNPAGSLSTRNYGKNKNNISSYWELTGITWESLGVPAGHSVTEVLGEYDYQCSEYTTGSPGSTGALEILDSTGTVTIATLVSGTAGFSSTTGWLTRTGTAQAIAESYRASNTSIRIRIHSNLSTGSSNSAAVTLLQDNLDLTLTTQAPGILHTQSLSDALTFADSVAAQLVESVTLVAKDATWKYYQNGSLDSTGWEADAYDDSTWSSGSAILGVETGAPSGWAINTALTLGTTITFYFRKVDINLPFDPADILSVQCRVVADDGFTLLVNGMNRGGLRNPAWPWLYSAYTEGGALAPEITEETFTFDKSWLRQGNNTFAVGVKQGNSGSSDITWGLELIVTRLKPVGTQHTQSLSDGLTLADALAKSVSMGLADAVSFSDPHSAQLSKSLQDLLTLLDALIRAPHKSLTDSIALADAIAASLVRVQALVDALSFSDAIAKEARPAITHTLNLSDAVTFQSAKPLTDSISFADLLAKAPAKAFADLVSFSDQARPEARKALTDALTLADTLRLLVHLVKQDSLTLADALAKLTGKSFTDSLALNDALASRLAKSLTDALTLADAIQATLLEAGVEHTKALSDALTFADALTRSAQKSLADPLALADALAKSSGKSLADLVALGDATALSLQKQLADAVTLADSVLRSATKTLTDALAFGEDISLSLVLVHALVDALAFTDQLSKLTGKSLADPIVWGDTLGPRAIGKALSDALAWLDAVAKHSAITRESALSLLDLIATARATSQALSDSLSFSDSVALEVLARALVEFNLTAQRAQHLSSSLSAASTASSLMVRRILGDLQFNPDSTHTDSNLGLDI